jgi:NAD(P)-dependent dehydrogenase (short-subunit alcohol dehydrogenase family)
MTDGFPGGYMDTQLPRILTGRLGNPASLAATLVWLVSEAAEYVTGQTILVDGGYSVT